MSVGVDARNNVKLIGWIGPRKPETGIIEVPPDSSITLNPEEQAEVSAVLTVDGREPILDIPTEKTPIGFSSSIGTIPWPSSRLQNGWTTEYFTAGTKPGSGFITLSLDNQQTMVPVTIRGEETTGTPSTPPASPTTPSPSTATSREPPQPEALPAPNFRSRSKRIQLKGRRATVGSITCGDACRVVSSRIQIVIDRRRYRVAITPHSSFSAGSTTPIRIELSDAALRALGKHGSTSVRGTITVAGAAGQSTTRTISATLGRQPESGDGKQKTAQAARHRHGLRSAYSGSRGEVA